MTCSFESQIDRYISGDMDLPDYNRLLQTLEDDPGLVDVLLDQIEMDLLLDGFDETERSVAKTGFHASHKNVFTTTLRNWRWDRIRIFLGCYVSLCLLIVFGSHWFPNMAGNRPLQAQSVRPETSRVSTFDSDTVARIGMLYEVAWEDSDVWYREGESLSPGDLAIRKGAFSLMLANGGEVVVEGPASLSFDSDHRLHCRSGQFFFRFPARHASMSIELPVATVNTNHISYVDNDMFFALRVEEGASEIHLIQDGTILAETPLSHRRQGLLAGEVFSVDTDEVFTRLEAGSRDFLDIHELKRLHTSRNWECYDKWKAEMERAKSDPTLVFMLDLDDGVYPGMLPGHAPRTSLSKQWGCMTAPGRFKLNQGLRFFWSVDRLDLIIPVRLASFTMITSVRLSSDETRHQSLLASEGVCWEIEPDGTMTVEIECENRRQIFRSCERLPSRGRGCWLQLAVVVDPSTRSVTYYLDGRKISSDAVLDSCDSWFGKSGIGDWTGDGRTRGFNGCLDEFRLYDRALSAVEIEQTCVRCGQ